jgi:glycosyltransferase involved in cell wall biosynthesis
MRRLRIGYLTAGNSRDVLNWSGLAKHIRDALEDWGHDIQEIDSFLPKVPLKTRLRGWRSRFILRKPYGYDRDVKLARSFAKLAERKIANRSLDCIVSAQTYPATMLRTTIPVASWCDATFHALMGVYPGYAEISKDSIRQGHYLERNAIQRSCFLAYASHWAADDAITYYGADPAKVAVVPFGANCSSAFASREAAEFAVHCKPMTPFRLLFMGRDWERKGGPLAVRILAELRQRGVDAELWVAGCSPFTAEVPAGVKCFGYLDKSHVDDLATWRRCFRECHALLMPTRAECFGVVFAEAAAFGLPSIATRIGGVADAVGDQVSGFLFAPDEGPDPYVDTLQRLASDHGYYRQTAMSAYRHYVTALNWRTAAAKFTELLLTRLEAQNRSKRLRAPGMLMPVQGSEVKVPSFSPKP